MPQNTTFGATAASQVLAVLVQEHPKAYQLSRKVARLLNQFHRVAGQIERLEDRAVAVVLYELAAEHYCQKAAGLFADTEKVATFTQNVIQSRKKQWLEQHPSK